MWTSIHRVWAPFEADKSKPEPTPTIPKQEDPAPQMELDPELIADAQRLHEEFERGYQAMLFAIKLRQSEFIQTAINRLMTLLLAHGEHQMSMPEKGMMAAINKHAPNVRYILADAR